MKETIKDYTAVVVIIILLVPFIVYILYNGILLRWVELFCVIVLITWSAIRVGKMVERKKHVKHHD